MRKSETTIVCNVISGGELKGAVERASIEYEKEACALTQKALRKLNMGFKFSPSEWKERLDQAGVHLAKALAALIECTHAAQDNKRKHNG
jgi:hypothetical protein